MKQRDGKDGGYPGDSLPDEPGWEPPAGFGLDANGNLQRPSAPGAAEDEPLELARPVRAPASVAAAEEPPLELARDIRRDEPGGLREVPSSPRWIKPLAAVAVLAVLAVAGVVLWPNLRQAFGHALPRQATPILHIDSEPSGADILIDGQSIGQTPFLTDNVYPDREIPFELRLRGYQPWRGKFHGAEEAKVDARLVRRGGGKAR